MKITLTSKGDFKKTKKFFSSLRRREYLRELDRFGAMGVQALQAATPVEAGATAGAWSYRVKTSGNGAEIAWFNGNTINGVNIAIILQYGHGTGTGGYVSGRDYINPAIKPVMDQIAEGVWRAVVSA